METQVKTSVKAEAASSTFPSVVVTAIFEPLSGNSKGKNVQVKWITSKAQSSARGLTSFFLGAMAVQNEEKRTALQFMGNDVIEKLKLDIGVNLNEALKEAGEAPVRLSISEIPYSEYLEAKEVSESSVIGYQQKVNPSSGEVMGYKNAPIMRKTFIDAVDGTDEYLQSDGSTVTIEDGITV